MMTAIKPTVQDGGKVVAAALDLGNAALDLLRHVHRAVDVVAPGVDTAVAGQRGGALVRQGDVDGVALDLLRHIGVGIAGVGQRDDLAVVGQGDDDVGVVLKMGDVALDTVGEVDVQQIGAAQLYRRPLSVNASENW